MEYDEEGWWDGSKADEHSAFECENEVRVLYKLQRGSAVQVQMG